MPTDQTIKYLADRAEKTKTIFNNLQKIADEFSTQKEALDRCYLKLRALKKNCGNAFLAVNTEYNRMQSSLINVCLRGDSRQQVRYKYNRNIKTLGRLDRRFFKLKKRINYYEQLLDETKSRYDQISQEILDLASVDSSYIERNNYKVKYDKEDQVCHIYYGGLGDNPSGIGHGHIILAEDGFLRYMREPFAEHGEDNHLESLEYDQASDRAISLKPMRDIFLHCRMNGRPVRLYIHPVNKGSVRVFIYHRNEVLTNDDSPICVYEKIVFEKPASALVKIAI